MFVRKKTLKKLISAWKKVQLYVSVVVRDETGYNIIDQIDSERGKTTWKLKNNKTISPQARTEHPQPIQRSIYDSFDN